MKEVYPKWQEIEIEAVSFEKQLFASYRLTPKKPLRSKSNLFLRNCVEKIASITPPVFNGENLLKLSACRTPPVRPRNNPPEREDLLCAQKFRESGRKVNCFVWQRFKKLFSLWNRQTNTFMKEATTLLSCYGADAQLRFESSFKTFMSLLIFI